MEREKVTVIIPAYNAEKYIKECIVSVSKQSYRELEILVVNDGSIDKTELILKKLQEQDNRIEILNQENRGISQARNTALEKATGEYVLFVDSDDWISSNTVEDAVYTMKNHSADVVLWPYSRVYPKAEKKCCFFGEKELIWDEITINILRKRLIGLDNEELKYPEQLDSPGTVWGKLYKRKLIGKTRFVDLDKIGSAEDLLFNISIFNRVQRAVYIPSIFYYYRKDNLETFTHEYNKEKVTKWRELFAEIRKLIKNNSNYLECEHALTNRICLSIIGLSLNIIEDTQMTFFEKNSELNKVLRMQPYSKCLQGLELGYFKIHWRIFFGCAKYKFALGMSLLLIIMDYFRKH